jgi:hypothetical protein
MTLLDKRIEEDLKELLYNNGLKDLIDKFNQCKIQKAEDLSIALFGKPDELSSHGLPGYFTGDRSARTVMVMLNPGQDVAGKDNPGTTQKTMDLLGININNFIYTYKVGNAAFGIHDRRERKNETNERIKKTKRAKNVYPDNFDLKQAAFLKEWPKDCGVVIPDSFPPKDNKLENMDYEEALTTAENVLTQKLQLELVPYASRKFNGINNYKPFFPFVETLFDEIFSNNYKGEKPRYVIFCSAFFEKLFDAYSDDAKEYPGWIEIIEKKEEKVPTILDRTISCSLLKIHRYGKKNDNQGGPSIKAIIAHTFPNQALPNAYDRMRNYGKFCYDVWNSQP